MHRAELQHVRDQALTRARAIGGANVILFRAWTELASAADRLDAMLAREAAPARRPPTINVRPAAVRPVPQAPAASASPGPDDFAGIDGDEPVDVDEDDLSDESEGEADDDEEDLGEVEFDPEIARQS